MIRLEFTVPIILEEPVAARKSPCCGSGVHVKGHGRRGLDDIRIGEVKVTRYTCKACGRSFTVRPAGVTRSSKSARVRAASVVLYLLGLSYDTVATAFGMFGIRRTRNDLSPVLEAFEEERSGCPTDERPCGPHLLETHAVADENDYVAGRDGLLLCTGRET